MLASLLAMLFTNSELGVASYGKFIFILTITSFISSLLSLRSGEAVVKFLINKELPSEQLYSSAFFFDLVIFVLYLVTISVAGGAFYYVSAGGLGCDYILLIILGLASSFGILSGLPNGILLYLEQYGLIAALGLVAPLVKILLLSFFYFSERFTLLSVCVSFLASSFLSFIIIWFVFVFNFKEAVELPTKSSLKKYFETAFVMYISLFFKSALINSEVLILGITTSESMVGVYQSLKIILQPINFLANPLGKIIYPKMAKSINEGQIKKITISIFKFSLLLFLSTLSCFGFLLLFSEFVGNLINVELIDNIYLLGYFFIVMISLSLGDWWFRSFSNSTNPRYSAISAIASSIYVWFVSFPASLFVGLNAFLISMIFMYLVRVLVFWKVLFSRRNV